MNIAKIRKFFIELAELLVNIVPPFAIGYFVGYFLFAQLPFTWYNVVLVLGLCSMSGIGYSAIVDIIKTNRQAKQYTFKVGE